MVLSDITISTIKTYHGYNSTDKDSQLSAILTMIISQVLETCGHDFVSTTRTNEIPRISAASKCFSLKYFPVDSVTSVVEDGVALTENVDFYVDHDTGEMERIANRAGIFDDPEGPCWSSAPAGVVVTYVGGHALTADMARVITEMVGIAAKIKTTTYIDLEGVEKVVTLQSLPKEMSAILDRHTLRGFIN